MYNVDFTPDAQADLVRLLKMNLKFIRRLYVSLQSWLSIQRQEQGILSH